MFVLYIRIYNSSSSSYQTNSIKTTSNKTADRISVTGLPPRNVQFLTEFVMTWLISSVATIQIHQISLVHRIMNAAN